MAQKERTKKIDDAKRKEFEEKFGVKLPKKLPTLKERWEKEQQIYEEKQRL